MQCTSPSPWRRATAVCCGPQGGPTALRAGRRPLKSLTAQLLGQGLALVQGDGGSGRGSHDSGRCQEGGDGSHGV